MAGGDDGFSEVGGGGSIHWRIEQNDTDSVQTNHKGKKHAHWGVDRPGATDVGPTKYFEILIGRPATEILWKRDTAGKVFLYVPIEDDPHQIKVAWVKDDATAHNGTKPL